MLLNLKIVKFFYDLLPLIYVQIYSESKKYNFIIFIDHFYSIRNTTEKSGSYNKPLNVNFQEKITPSKENPSLLTCINQCSMFYVSYVFLNR